MQAIYSFFSSSSFRHAKFTQAQTDKSIGVMEISSLSDTRWVCCHAAVQLFLNRYECLISALESIIDQQKLLACPYSCKSFLLYFFLQVFHCVLGLTKPLSDTLQTKQLNLATVIDLVEATCKTLSDECCEKFFEDNIWKCSLTLARNMNIDVAMPCARKRHSAG